MVLELNVNLRSMRRPGGYGIFTTGDRMDSECDTFTCRHCNRIVRVKLDASNVGELCKMCDELTCQRADCSPALNGCAPFEKKLETYERHTRFEFSAYGPAEKGRLWLRVVKEIKLRG